MQTYIRYSAIAITPLVLVGVIFLLFNKKEDGVVIPPPEEISTEAPVVVPVEKPEANISPEPEIVPTAPQAPLCVTGGCSGQICGEADEVGGIMTTCEYKEEYACFKTHSTCERQQSTGKCGWTQTPELTQCIEGAKQNTNTVQ